MICYDKIDVSKRIDICHYWYFLNKGFKSADYQKR